MTESTLIQVLLVVMSSLLSFGTAWFVFRRGTAATALLRKTEEEAVLKSRLVELERQISLISLAVQPITAAFQAILIKELTHFHTPVLDALMRKLTPFTLTLQEERQMNVELEARTRDMSAEISDSERDAARMLPMVIKRVRAELKVTQEGGNTTPDMIQMVTVPAALGPPE